MSILKSNPEVHWAPNLAWRVSNTAFIWKIVNNNSPLPISYVIFHFDQNTPCYFRQIYAV